MNNDDNAISYPSTFNELSDHHCVLFIAVCKLLPSYAWKSRFNNDKTSYDGYFLLGLSVTGIGQIIYSVLYKYWDLADSVGIITMDAAPPLEHHDADVTLSRLISLTRVLPSRLTGLLRG
jgi:hypothetical protein